MNKGLLQIAEGFAMVAEGYRKMASEGLEIPKDDQTEEKPEKSSTSEKKISITEVRGVMAEKSRAGRAARENFTCIRSRGRCARTACRTGSSSLHRG